MLYGWSGRSTEASKGRSIGGNIGGDSRPRRCAVSGLRLTTFVTMIKLQSMPLMRPYPMHNYRSCIHCAILKITVDPWVWSTSARATAAARQRRQSMTSTSIRAKASNPEKSLSHHIASTFACLRSKRQIKHVSRICLKCRVWNPCTWVGVSPLRLRFITTLREWRSYR